MDAFHGLILMTVMFMQRNVLVEVEPIDCVLRNHWNSNTVMTVGMHTSSSCKYNSTLVSVSTHEFIACFVSLASTEIEPLIWIIKKHGDQFCFDDLIVIVHLFCTVPGPGYVIICQINDFCYLMIYDDQYQTHGHVTCKLTFMMYNDSDNI